MKALHHCYNWNLVKGIWTSDCWLMYFRWGFCPVCELGWGLVVEFVLTSFQFNKMFAYLEKNNWDTDKRTTTLIVIVEGYTEYALLYNTHNKNTLQIKWSQDTLIN